MKDLAHRFVILVAAAALASAASAQSAVKLSDTDLYAKQVHGCRTVALSGWHHPVRNVLEAGDASIDKVELCNDEHFPVFTVKLKYDPSSPETASFYDQLYAKIAQANGWWSYALVDESDDEVIIVTTDKVQHSLSVAMEGYTP